MEDHGFAMEKIAQHSYTIYRSAISMATLEYLDGQKLAISCSLEPLRGWKIRRNPPVVPPFRCGAAVLQLLVDD